MQQATSILRHLLTFLAGLGALLAARGLIAPQDAPAVDAAGSSLIEPLALILAAVAVAVVRLLMAWCGHTFSVRGDGSAKSLAALALPWAGMAGVMGFNPPSCTPSQIDAAKQVPVKACYIDRAGNSVCYSTAEGVTATVDRRSGK
jgi:hypothetical protein